MTGIITQDKFEVGYPKYDIVGEHFEAFAKKHKLEPAFAEIERKHIVQSDEMLHMLVYKNRMVAFVIERRDDFNDIEYTFGELEDKPPKPRPEWGSLTHEGK